MTAKEQFLEMMGEQPDNISPEEQSYNARIYSDIIVSLKEVEEGKLTSHEEIKAMVETWE